MDELRLEAVIDLGAQARIATSMTLVSLSKFMSHTCEAISDRGSTSPWRRSSSSSSANSLAVRSMRGRCAPPGGAAGPVPGRPRACSRLLAAAAAPQQGAHPGQQFGEGEGLDQVIVGAEFETFDAVFDVVARGQEQHRHVAAGACADWQHLPAIQPGSMTSRISRS
jgi:hypothetical protein